MSTRPALKMTGLRKSFGTKVVLDGIDLEIEEGSTFSCSVRTEPGP